MATVTITISDIDDENIDVSALFDPILNTKKINSLAQKIALGMLEHASTLAQIEHMSVESGDGKTNHINKKET